MSAPATEPALMHLPAILQNPTNHALRQVVAYNTQQREKTQARRDARSAPIVNNGGSGRGKRVVRRKDNAAFTSNPHITPPLRSDYYPPVPLQSHPSRPAFPTSSLPRSIPVPPANLPDRDPFAPSSLNGAFTTSLKGTRALLRKRGRRVEQLVGVVEGQIRDWVGGESWSAASGSSDGTWRVIDSMLVDVIENESGQSTSPSSSTDRRLPEQHQVKTALPALPICHASTPPSKQVPAVLEFSRSPAHLTWAVAESFERLVIHLIARYYELISWSEDHVTIVGEKVRLTHLIIPSIALPKVPPATNSLLTPETSDLSGQSSSDRDVYTDTSGESDTESDAGTAMGEEIGYSLDPEPEAVSTTSRDLQGIPPFVDTALLQRIPSNTSSTYASSEGDSDFDGLGDSLTLRPTVDTGGWTVVEDTGSESGSLAEVKKPRQLAGTQVTRKGRMDRPSFFEYLYGA